MAEQEHSYGRRAARRRNSAAAEDAAAVVAAAAEDFAARSEMLAKLSTIPPEDRTEEHINELIQATRHLQALESLSQEEHCSLARVWQYDELGCLEILCSMNDENPEYYIVVSGRVELVEYKLTHRLGETAVEARTPRRPSEAAQTTKTPRGRTPRSRSAAANAATRRTVVGMGKAFGQFPLLQMQQHVDYSARAATCGCGLLRVSKMNYVQLLRRREDRQMSSAVKMLRASPFFSMWTRTSLERE